MNSNSIQTLPLQTCKQVSAGVSLSTVLLIVEIPHALLIAREATNYIGKLWVEGCQGVDEGDYFTQFFCGLVP